MPDISLVLADCKVALRAMIERGEFVDSVVTDPPYGLLSIIKRFGKNQAAARIEGTDGSFSRLSEGFMGRQWDGSGIETDIEFWKLVLAVLKPGGYLLAFSSPRTGHRMATAIEAAGFVMHPFIGWAYGSGLPKQKDAAHFIEKVSPEAADEWEGYGYGAQARRPALEPIYVAQKPFSERNGALNILKWGVGAVDLDGCRNERGNHPANLISDGGIENHHLFERYTYICESCHDTGWMIEGEYDNAIQIPCWDCGGECNNPDPFGAQRVFYAPKAGKIDRAGSKHPSVKPIRLMRSLVRHVTPVGGVVLDPFAGTGTTGAAALLEGRDVILLEREPDYAKTIARRFGLELGALNLADRLFG